jgi:hypothetical protein
MVSDDFNSYLHEILTVPEEPDDLNIFTYQTFHTILDPLWTSIRRQHSSITPAYLYCNVLWSISSPETHESMSPLWNSWYVYVITCVCSTKKKLMWRISSSFALWRKYYEHLPKYYTVTVLGLCLYVQNINSSCNMFDSLYCSAYKFRSPWLTVLIKLSFWVINLFKI